MRALTLLPFSPHGEAHHSTQLVVQEGWGPEGGQGGGGSDKGVDGHGGGQGKVGPCAP